MRIPPLFLFVLSPSTKFPCPPCDPWIKNFCETLDLRQPINHLLAVVAILPITHVNPECCALDARTLEDELVKLLIHQPTQPLTTYCRGRQYDICRFTNEVLTLAHTAHRLVERRTTVTRTDDDGTTGILAQGL